MLPSEQRLVEEVIQSIRNLQRRGPDDLDIVEMIMDLQEEFGVEAVKWAFRFLMARGARRTLGPPVQWGSRFPPARWAAQGAGPVFGEQHPMWDRDLDGWADR